MTTEILALAVGITIAMVLNHLISYELGERAAARKHFRISRQVFRDLVDMQREAGVTTEQLEKINEQLAKRVLADFKGIIDPAK